MKVLIFGATGMLGHGVLLECLDAPEVESVATVGRRAPPIEHDKLVSIEHADFDDFGGLEEQLTGYDACFWCLGIASSGMSESDYRRITVGYTKAAAEVLARVNPKMTFCFISGGGTDREGRAMWARVKAEAEDCLADFPFAAHYNFRPAFIQPMRGVRSRTTLYRTFYAVLGPLYPLLKKMPKYVSSTPEVGQAMLEAALHGAPKVTLENADICALADVRANR